MNRFTLSLLFLLCLFSCESSYGQAGMWTWIKGQGYNQVQGNYSVKGVPSPVVMPKGRIIPITFNDGRAGKLWLYGGYFYGGSSANEYALDDLWKFDISTGMWTWVAGSSTGNTNMVSSGVGVSSASNYPGSRDASAAWQDKQGNLWMFGGNTYWYSTSQGIMSKSTDDIWKYDLTTKWWTQIKGRSTTGSPVYGAKGIPSSANTPGYRGACVTWVDTSGNFWLFGGDSWGFSSYSLNELWKYDPTVNMWTWMSGDSTNGKSIYGIKGLPSPNNHPGKRSLSVSWADTSGNLWLYGGTKYLYSSPSINEWYGDLWRYSISKNEWTWVGGDSIKNAQPTYGLQGVPNAANNPGGRRSALGATDKNGHVYLYSGQYSGNSTDLWSYDMTMNEWTWIKGDSASAWGTYGTQGVSSPTNNPMSEEQGSAWVDSSGNFWILGAYRTDLWRYSPSITLPLHLLTFTAKLQDNTSLLIWTTNNEQNTSRFIIERSLTGRDFQPIGQVKATNKAGTNNYTYSDPLTSQLTSAISFCYRLRMGDKDGKYTYSNVITLTRNQKPETVSIFPNPAKDKLYITGKGITRIKLVDDLGRVIMNKRVAVVDNITIDVSPIARGVYNVQVSNAKGVVTTRLVLDK